MKLSELIGSDSEGQRGISELQVILDYIQELDLVNEVVIDLSLARGLSYYTGAILEVKALDVTMGSISGGGRYDNLTGIFGLEGLSGVGISFGADRIYDVMSELNLFPDTLSRATELMFVNFGEQDLKSLMPIVARLRKAGIRTEVYPDEVKLKKQMNYANVQHIAYVALVGEEERLAGAITLKNMITGEQVTLSEPELITYLRPTQAEQ